jgi:hypothetical protein
VRIGFKLQVTATMGFHSLYDWCYQTMWLFSGAPDDPENDTVMEKHVAEALNSAVKGLTHAFRTKDEEAELDVAHQMIQIGKPWMIMWCSESTLANNNPPDWIANENAHLIDSECTVEEKAHQKTQVEWYSSWCASGEYRVHRGQ